MDSFDEQHSRTDKGGNLAGADGANGFTDVVNR